ncbi:hypothetical protein DSC45_29710 [Streptomyces sp. YIM 130001]|uniref:anthrone oxygenase family protein n=1 Tax=Streptomyces sp. YIM 130001 TaxID=2259644 RepID=UPI000ED7B58D|nr:DUF1772 domain-containing protein [Streptomyces sp. YIM 130001]RII09685.1 hypothetical protein DSC45_29710 [Streptomyces sp. YIM 130001]
MTYNTAYPTPQRADTGAARDGILFLSIIVTGLLAGVFADWSNTIMPGLGDLDDRTFVLAFQSLDDAINNPLFLGAFTVAPLLIALCAVLRWRTGRRAMLWWILGGLLSYVVVALITFGVHLPLNEDIGAVGRPENAAAAAAARDQLDEAAWTTWNTVRALAATLSFGCLVLAFGLRNQSRPLSSR